MAIFSRLANPNPVKVSGKISHLNAVSTTTGVVRNEHGNVRTDHELWFRVSGRPAVYEGVLSLAEGDTVTVVGRDRGDAVIVVALRNDTTGIEHTPVIRTWPMWLLIAIGVPMIPFVIGLLLIGLGVLGFLGNKQNRQMIALLRDTPLAAHTTAAQPANP